MIYVKYVYNICRIYDTLLTNKAQVAEETKLIYLISLYHLFGGISFSKSALYGSNPMMSGSIFR